MIKIIPIKHYLTFTIYFCGLISIMNTYSSNADLEKLNIIVQDIKNAVCDKFKKDYSDNPLKLAFEEFKLAFEEENNSLALMHYHWAQNKDNLCEKCLLNIGLSSKIDKSLNTLLVTCLQMESPGDKNNFRIYVSDVFNIFSTLSLYKNQLNNKYENYIDKEPIKLQEYETVKHALTSELFELTKTALFSSIFFRYPVFHDEQAEKISEYFLWIKENLDIINLQIPDLLSTAEKLNNNHSESKNRNKSKIQIHPAAFTFVFIFLCISGYFNVKHYLESCRKI